MSYGGSSYAEHSYGEGSPAAGSPSIPDLPAAADAALTADAIRQALPAASSAALNAEHVTDGVQVSGPDAAALSASAIRQSLPAASSAALNADPISQPLSAPDAAELTAETLASVSFTATPPLILSAEYIYSTGAGTWRTISLTAVVGKSDGQFLADSITGVS